MAGTRGARKATSLLDDPVVVAQHDFLPSDTPDSPVYHLSLEARARIERASRVVVTTALNNSPVEKAYDTLRRYCDSRGAELVVLQARYRNPTSDLEAKRRVEEEVWPRELQPYLCANQIRLHEQLYVMGDIPIAATARNPLTGLDGLTRGASAIFGHAQLAMETIPTPQNELPKILHTTGSITAKRYSRSTAGAKGAFNHSVGGIVVEKKGGRFHLRQLIADGDHVIYDLNTRYTSTGKPTLQRSIPALVTGDSHIDRIDSEVVRGTYGPGGIVDRLRPREIIWHDLLDMQSGSHHNNPLEELILHLAGRGSVKDEVRRALEFVKQNTPAWAKSTVIPSNHNDHLARWALTKHWTEVKHYDNALFLLELQRAMLEGSRYTPAGVVQMDPLAAMAKQWGYSKINFLQTGESHRIRGVETGFHGHVGPSGTRGSRRAFDRIGTRSFIGHSHAPGILRGVWQVGTSSLLGLVYAQAAASAWLHTHGLIHENGKRQLINLLGSEWCDE